MSIIYSFPQKSVAILVNKFRFKLISVEKETWFFWYQNQGRILKNLLFIVPLAFVNSDYNIFAKGIAFGLEYTIILFPKS